MVSKNLDENSYELGEVDDPSTTVEVHNHNLHLNLKKFDDKIY